MTRLESRSGPSGGSPPSHELFVCGRLCLLGEHSDWAGGFRSENPDVPVGKCLVLGTGDAGLHATVTADAPGSTLEFASTDDRGVRRERRFALDDPAALALEASEGGFWSHVAGTCLHMVTDAPRADLTNRALARRGLRIVNHRTTLPVKKGLSSSAAVCVLIARAFSVAFGLGMDAVAEMDAAYAGERRTPSKCGRMDQACAFGPGRPVLLTFDGADPAAPVRVEPLLEIGADLHLVVADLELGKDTVAILRNLQRAYPSHGNDPVFEGVHRLLGESNHAFIETAVDAIARGDARALGRAYADAQAAFDASAGKASPAELAAPGLKRCLRHPKLAPGPGGCVLGGKGVGSQGDGAVQFVCDGEEGAARCAEVLAQEFGLKAMRITVRKTADARDERERETRRTIA